MNLDSILHPIIVAFAWIWVQIHNFLVLLGFSDGAGYGWVLSILLLTLLVRIAIIPLYIKQIKSSRGMQLIQPEMQKVQAKYKGKTDQVSRQRQSEEMSALYKKNGSSPFASCLPMLVQMPVLFALYRVIFAVESLKDGNYAYPNLGPLTEDMAREIAASKFLGVSLFESLSSTPGALKAVFIILILLMVGFQFLTMRLSMKRNMPPAQDPNNPMVRSQKMMMYMMPAMFIFTGLIFKMALLIYMVTTTIFSWAQQFWVVKVMPTPGAPAYIELVEKREKKYQAWAKPLFEDYDQQREGVKDDEAAVGELVEKTLVSVKEKAKKEKVRSDFPEEWTAAEQLSVYRGLAREPWKTLPDEQWLKGIAKAHKSPVDNQSRQSKQPKKLSREQRARRERATQEQLDIEAKAQERADRKAAQKESRPGASLSPEEIEKRRQERRASQRKQGKSGQNKSKNRD